MLSTSEQKCLQQPLELFRVNVSLSQMRWKIVPQPGSCSSKASFCLQGCCRFVWWHMSSSWQNVADDDLRRILCSHSADSLTSWLVQYCVEIIKDLNEEKRQSCTGVYKATEMNWNEKMSVASHKFIWSEWTGSSFNFTSAIFVALYMPLTVSLSSVVLVSEVDNNYRLLSVLCYLQKRSVPAPVFLDASWLSLLSTFLLLTYLLYVSRPFSNRPRFSICSLAYPFTHPVHLSASSSEAKGGRKLKLV